MKKHFQKIVFWFNKISLINRFLIVASIVYFITKIIKSIKERIDRDAALKATQDDIKNPTKNNPQDITTVRSTLLETVAKNIYDECQKYFFSGSELMTQVELCQNKQEVIYLSLFYANMYNQSLLAVLKKKLDAKYNPLGWGAGTRFVDLKPLIKDNLS